MPHRIRTKQFFDLVILPPSSAGDYQRQREQIAPVPSFVEQKPISSSFASILATRNLDKNDGLDGIRVIPSEAWLCPTDLPLGGASCGGP
jgi:hypothetical protein